MKARTLRRKYETDVLMKGLWLKLVEDFRSLYGNEYKRADVEALKQGMHQFRFRPVPAHSNVDVDLFRREVQLDKLFKRYRFKDDPISADERAFLTEKKFFQHQEKLGKPKPEIKLRTLKVLQEARKIIKGILGPFDPKEHLEVCRFGKRACKGVPAAHSYIDEKLEVLSGTIEHIKWFKNDYLGGDTELTRALDLGVNPTYDVVKCLDMVNVAKSWKIDRGIVPNSVIGSLHSYGVGAIIQSRLKDIGLDIQRLQDTHKVYAMLYSKTREYVTADMANASNGYTYVILSRLLPRDWLAQVKFGRIPDIQISDGPYAGIHRIESYMLMGIGFTFPLQTLLFYSIIQAIQLLLGKRHMVSVYGDDLIYHRSIHGYVAEVFNDLDFELNSDKTFVKDYFRESCGGDYYRGVPSRPFQPEGETQRLSASDFVCLLHKTINGLLERWTIEEIPKTYHWLLSQVASINGLIFQVPSYFPDYSGVKVKRLMAQWRGLRQDYPWSTPYTKDGITHFSCFGQKSYDRFVINEAVYYWDTLRANSSRTDSRPVCEHDLFGDRSTMVDPFTGDSTKKFRLLPITTIDEKSGKTKFLFYRSSLNGRWWKRKRASVARKGAQRYIHQSQVGILPED